MAAWLRRMVGVVLGLMLAAGLAACGKRAVDDGGAAIDETALNAIASSGPSVAEVLARGNASVATPAMPAPTGFDETGTWAATAASCATAAWRFTAAAASTPDATRCRVTGTEIASNSAKRLKLACRVEGFETIESWALVRREDGSMTVARSEGGNGVPKSVTLRRCG